MLQAQNCWNCIRSCKRKQMSHAALYGRCYCSHTTHREVVALKLNEINTASRFQSVLFKHSSILSGNCGGSGSLPHLGRKESFNIVGEPEKLRMGILNC